jgi:hypothetical protein
LRDSFSNIVCTSENVVLPVWKIAYLETPLEAENLGDPITPWYDLENPNFTAGIDARLGKLLLAWSALMKERQGQDPPLVKVAVVTEPGCKIRPVTSGPTWLYSYLSPAGHIFKDYLSQLPGAHVGLKESDHLYRFGESFHNHFKESGLDGLLISTSDLTSATDRAVHKICEALMKGIASGMMTRGVITPGLHDYLVDCIELLCSPRIVRCKISRREYRRLSKDVREKLTPDKEKSSHYTFKTVRGVLMGEPLTKSVLTAASMVAYQAAKRGLDSCTMSETLIMGDKRSFREREREKILHYSCAGDDHTGISRSLDALKKIPKVLESMGFEISWEKYRISRKYVHYCQDFGFAPSLRSTIHMDTPRMRLFNQFRKEGAFDNFETPDPLRGKAKDLERRSKAALSVERFETPLQRKLDECLAMFLRANMTFFYEKNVLFDLGTYAPSLLGGVGVPLPGWIKEPKIEDFCRKSLASMLYETKADCTTQSLWSRGISTKINLYSAEVLGIDEGRLRSSDEVWNSVYSDLHSEADSTAPSRRRIYKMIATDYVDISRPNNVVGNKEYPYGSLVAGTARKVKVKPTRTRQSLRQVWNFRKSGPYEGPVPTTVDQLNSVRPRAYVSRDYLQMMTNTGFVSPRLDIQGNFFNMDMRGSCEPRRFLSLAPVMPLRPDRDHTLISELGESASYINGITPEVESGHG